MKRVARAGGREMMLWRAVMRACSLWAMPLPLLSTMTPLIVIHHTSSNEFVNSYALDGIFNIVLNRRVPMFSRLYAELAAAAPLATAALGSIEFGNKTKKQ